MWVPCFSLRVLKTIVIGILLLALHEIALDLMFSKIP